MILQLKNVSKSFQVGLRTLEVIRTIQLSIEKGEFLAIVGPSGSGKSTLLYLLGLLERPTSGQVLMDGRDLTNLPDHELALFRNKTIGFVFQSFQLLPKYTALENVSLPLVYSKSWHRQGNAKKFLERFGLGNRLNHRPVEMSGGECQRVAICRALINDPQILLADEPTGSLDSKTGAEIMGLLLDLHKSGMTLVVITHDLHIAKIAQRVLHFSDGKFLE